MLHLMLDLETLGTAPGSAIIDIGIMPFVVEGENPDYKHEGCERLAVLDPLHYMIEPQSAIDAGLAVDAATVMWWADQRAKDGKDNNDLVEHPIHRALADVHGYLNEIERLRRLTDRPYRLWAYGANFDPPLLEAAFRTVLKRRAPWYHRNVRCLRTFFAMHPRVELERYARDPKHNALGDARHQTRELLATADRDGINLNMV